MTKQSTKRLNDRLKDKGSTDARLLKAVSEWDDQVAWAKFRRQYDPKLRHWCRSHGLDAASTDEVCQIVWIELAGRMKTFCYDPNGTFRGWLRHLWAWRLHDFLRNRWTGEFLNADQLADLSRPMPADMADSHDNPEADLIRLELLERAEMVQTRVKQRVNPRTWEAFWLVSVQDWTVEQTAASLAMTRVAVYAARERVAKMLREEGKRVFHE